MSLALHEYRCPTCHKLLFKGVVVEAEIEVMCKGCKSVATITRSKYDDLLCMIDPCPNRIHCPSAGGRPKT